MQKRELIHLKNSSRINKNSFSGEHNMNCEYKKMIEESSAFKDWKRRRSKYYIQNTILIWGTVILISTGLIFAGVENFELKEILFAIILLLLFGGVGAIQAKKWIKSKNQKIDACWFGTVTDMYRNLRQNKKVKNYRIVADVEGKTLEGMCLLETYKRVKVGDRVLLFTVGTETIYCIQLKM